CSPLPTPRSSCISLHITWRPGPQGRKQSSSRWTRLHRYFGVLSDPLSIPPSYENGIMARVRMDKWLWAARFFKTRALAARACELGRIESNGQQAKAAREVRVGDLLHVKNDGGDFQVEVVLLSEMRGPAVVAQTLYRETEASRELRLK